MHRQNISNCMLICIQTKRHVQFGGVQDIQSRSVTLVKDLTPPHQKRLQSPESQMFAKHVWFMF